jgi:threonine synthase
MPLAKTSPATAAWPSPIVSLSPPSVCPGMAIHAKLEIFGPTGSHKDREVALILGAARREGHTAVGCSSTGNLALALTAASRSAGLGCELWLAAGASEWRMKFLRLLGAQVHVVDGDYAEAVRIGNAAMAQRGVFNANPSQCELKMEASRDLGREILAEVPATHVVCAANNGSLALGLLQACREAPQPVNLVAVTSPTGQRAHSITGTYGLEAGWRAARNSADCRVVEAADPEIERWERWLESQGLSVLPAAAATLAALPQLVLQPGDQVVCVLSGAWKSRSMS